MQARGLSWQSGRPCQPSRGRRSPPRRLLGDEKILKVLGRIVGATKHVEHLAGDDEPAGEVDGRERYGERRERLGVRVGYQTATELHHAAHDRKSRDGVGDRHERRVESVGDAADGLGSHPS